MSFQIAMSSGSKSVVGKTAQVMEDWEGAFGAFCGLLRPLAGLNPQQRIVTKLEALLAKVDACRQRLEKIPTLLKRFRQSVLAASCSGRLTADWREKYAKIKPNGNLLEKVAGNSEGIIPNDVPLTWVSCHLSSISDLITKGASPKWQGINYTNEGILFITSENVGWGKILLNQKKYVEQEINIIQPRSILEKGDLLTNIVGASIGRSAIYNSVEKANINQAVALIRLRGGINHTYILQVLNSPQLTDYMHDQEVDVARANLSLADVRNFPIPLPLLEEQHEIVRRVEALFKIADRIEERYQRAKTQVDKLTQSILAKAFRGELVPQDPNDEPASVLLERIKHQKNLGINPKRKKHEIEGNSLIPPSLDGRGPGGG